ncbi:MULTISPECIES: hypothetical protein [unclassified Microcoleus]|uniref:hypothetical protein n=1 Tax=unclassified Microcoleus TaxID=2642155 RepID=UPI002FD01878
MTDIPLSASLNTDHSNASIIDLELSHKLSFSHIKAAAHFAKLSYEIEEKYDDSKDSSEVFDEHRSYVIGSIITTVSYLEATINELFTDVADGVYSNGLDHNVIALMTRMWKLEIKPPNTTKGAKTYSPLDDLKPSVLQKFQIALTLAGKDLFDTGKAPYQDVDYLILLRNALIHYKPEWIGTGEKYKDTLNEKLRKKLESRIQTINPMTREGSLFFPHQCLGYGCAKWAVESSVNFSNEFFSKIGLPSNLDQNYQLTLQLPNIK